MKESLARACRSSINPNPIVNQNRNHWKINALRSHTRRYGHVPGMIRYPTQSPETARSVARSAAAYIFPASASASAAFFSAIRIFLSKSTNSFSASCTLIISESILIISPKRNLKNPAILGKAEIDSRLDFNPCNCLRILSARSLSSSTDSRRFLACLSFPLARRRSCFASSNSSFLSFAFISMNPATLFARRSRKIADMSRRACQQAHDLDRDVRRNGQSPFPRPVAQSAIEIRPARFKRSCG